MGSTSSSRFQLSFFLDVFLSAGLGLWGIVILITIGMTFGDAIGYFVGNIGRNVVKLDKKEHKILNRLEKFRDKHHTLPLVIMFLYAAFAPIPNELVVVPLSFLGYRMVHVLLAVLLGNFIFNSLAALTIIGLL